MCARIVKTADLVPLRIDRFLMAIEDFEKAYKPENIMTYGLPTEEMRRYRTLTRNEVAACEMIVQAEEKFKEVRDWVKVEKEKGRESRLEELVNNMLEIAEEQYEGDIRLVGVKDALEKLKEKSQSGKEENEQGGSMH